MQQNLDRQCVWRPWHVRLGIVLIVTCLVVVLALVIKFVILSNHVKHNESEVLNNKTTQSNGSNVPVAEASITHRSTQVTLTVEDAESLISTTFSPNQWIIDSYLVTRRCSFGAVVMGNTKIMVSGGTNPLNTAYGELSSSEIYSSVNRKWQAAADMQLTRSWHTLTVLPDGKSILAIGSFDRIDSYTAELYDIETDRWTFVPSIMNIGRCYHTATLLQNGQVLVVGGRADYLSITTSGVQLYDSSSNTFINTGSLNIDRHSHTATLLNDGLSVLVTGGRSMRMYTLSTAEVYTAASWSYTASNMSVARANHAAVLLLDGNVLVTGGSDDNEHGLSSVEIYNPITHTFSPTQPMACERSGLTLSLLSSGQVLAVGGSRSITDKCPLVAELYNPKTGQWISTPRLHTIRYCHATALLDNSVLVIGGQDDTHITLDQCERYEL